MIKFLKKESSRSFDETVVHIEKVIQEEGFSHMLTKDIDKIFKKKLGIDYPRYTTILACAPEFAKLPWAVVDTVDTNEQHIQLHDMLETGEVIWVPLNNKESFYIAAHLHSSDYAHWENLMADSGMPAVAFCFFK